MNDHRASPRAFSLFVAAFSLACIADTNASGDCEKYWEELYSARAHLNLADFRRKVIEALDNASCSAEQRRKISRDAVLAHIEAASHLPLNERLSVYESAIRFGRPWQLLEAMGVLLQTKRQDAEQDFSGASQLFQEALSDVQNAQAAARANNEDVLRILRLAQQSRFLSPVFVRGSNFGIETRGIKVQSAIVPIQFIRDSDTMTGLGAKYADELVAYLRAKQLPRLLIIGHTDHDGRDSYNLALSRRRANTVKSFLMTNGYGADRIKTTGKGYHEPIKLENAESFDDDQVKQLLRRVEVQIVP